MVKKNQKTTKVFGYNSLSPRSEWRMKVEIRQVGMKIRQVGMKGREIGMKVGLKGMKRRQMVEINLDGVSSIIKQMNWVNIDEI